jgi:hypothetical protein
MEIELIHSLLFTRTVKNELEFTSPTVKKWRVIHSLLFTLILENELLFAVHDPDKFDPILNTLY